MSTKPWPMEPIAIVGMAGRFPGAADVRQHWDNLRRGVESIAFFSDEELAAAGVDAGLLHNPRYVRARGVLQDAELFDAGFFGLSPREAEIMDPQHRVFLETAWQAFENAGYAPGVTALNVGVYAGASLNSYLIASLIANPERMLAAGGYQAMLANDKDFLATRVCYKLNLRGPGVTIQTACSTSLVAVQTACQALVAYECDMALAGGVSINVPRVTGYLYEPGMILSPDGHCRAFDARAQGTVAGEGVGVVVLKRLREALADRDHILAIIRGAAINNDGSLKVGYTAPSVDGQAAVIARAHAMAGVDPSTITYVEAHGTGTELGDPIEIAALTQAFRAATDRRGFCALGSVKTNIGHLDAAAGVAGLIKTVLALEHHAIPPSLHFSAPNPLIDFASSPFRVNATLTEWERVGNTPRRAGVSSFGIGGTNAHVVLEEAPPQVPTGPSRPVQILTLSAKSEAALARATSNLIGHLTSHTGLDLADAAFTLHQGRSVFPHRRVVVAGSGEEAARALGQKDVRRVITAVESRKERPVVFMFSGQGSQYVGMGRGLYESEPTFRDRVDGCSETLAPMLGFDLREVLYPASAGLEAAKARLSTTAVTQPALFVVEYALAGLFMDWGVRPQAMLGHSIGEYVAACLAGVLRIGDALRLVAERGRLMEVPGGAMLAVPMAERELAGCLSAALSIAAVNGPALCAVSGPAAAVEEFKARLAKQGIEALPIHAAAAFHSAMMEPILGAFTGAVRGVTLAAPTIPYVSNVTGTWVTAAEAGEPGYWARHLRQTVRFWDGLQEVTREGDAVLLEVGPGHTLASLARHASTPNRPLPVLSSLRHPNDQQSDAAVLQATVGRLWLAGVPVDWAGYHAGERRSRVPLPTYPFERERHWIEGATTPEQSPVRLHQLRKRQDIASWFYVPSWRRTPTRAPDSETLAGAWLVFADDCGLAPAIVGRLEDNGASVATVVKGKEFSRLAEGRFTINPDVRDDYDRLIVELKSGGAFPRRILHLWSVTRDGDGSGGAEASNGGQAHEFHSLLCLAQALGDHGMRERVSLGVVVNNLQDVAGDAVFRPHRGTVLGPSIALPQELAHLSCRTIDVILPETVRDTDVLVGQLLGELEEPVEAHVVAYRGRYRWLQDWEKVRLEAGPRSAALRQSGVYLITGGLGGIGLALARHLAEGVGARLVLVGRTALPPREEWTSWVDRHDETDATAAKIRAIRWLEEAGAEVLVFSADVADSEQMVGVLAESRRRFGAINGVIHAAGVLELGIIQLKTRETAERVLRAKVRGTTVLWELLREDEPDFFFLCSSISTVVGGPGLADYRGANAFLDAFARSRVAAGHGRTRVISAKFDAWQEVGMAVALGEAHNLPDAIHPTEGVEVFERILASDLTEVVVSTRELPLLITLARRETAAIRQAQEADAAVVTPSGAPVSRAGLSTPFVAPSTEFELRIAEIWQKLLGIERIGTQDDFFEAGGHSLLATQVMSRLFQRFDVDVPLRAIFEATTLGAFAGRVEEIVRAAGAEREEIEL
jgi:acyl transferase domain-containing protein/acyl carrier protein